MIQFSSLYVVNGQYNAILYEPISDNGYTSTRAHTHIHKQTNEKMPTQKATRILVYSELNEQRIDFHKIDVLDQIKWNENWLHKKCMCMKLHMQHKK